MDEALQYREVALTSQSQSSGQEEISEQEEAQLLDQQQREAFELLRWPMTAKVCLHYIVGLSFHLFLFMMNVRRDITMMYQTFGMASFYIIFAIYLYFSALQIKYGFPDITRGHSFTYSTDLLMRIAFRTYKVIPFLLEIRAIYDWTITKTSLDLVQFFKMEDAYANLYLDKGGMDARRARIPAEPRPFHEKCFMGACFLFLIMVVIVGPIILFSSLNPIMESEDVASGLFYGILETKTAQEESTYFQLFDNAGVYIDDLTDEEWDWIHEEYHGLEGDKDDFQKIWMRSYADTSWTITDASYK